MNCAVRLIKHDHIDVVLSAPQGQEKKSRRQNEREFGNKFKDWIAELAQRKRADEQSAVQIFAAIP